MLLRIFSPCWGGESDGQSQGGVIFLSSGPDCRDDAGFLLQLVQAGGPCRCCQRWGGGGGEGEGGALQMLSSKLRWTILQRFASSQNLHTAIFHASAACHRVENSNHFQSRIFLTFMGDATLEGSKKTHLKLRPQTIPDQRNVYSEVSGYQTLS